MDDGSFGYLRSSFRFKVEDVGTMELTNVLLRFGFLGRTTLIWPLDLIRDGSDGATLAPEDMSVLNCFVWSVAITATSSLCLVLCFENSDSARFN
jgi:hypothetical protein